MVLNITNPINVNKNNLYDFVLDSTNSLSKNNKGTNPKKTNQYKLPVAGHDTPNRMPLKTDNKKNLYLLIICMWWSKVRNVKQHHIMKYILF